MKKYGFTVPMHWMIFVAILLWSATAAADFKFTAIPDQDTARLEARFGKVAQ